MNESSSHQLCRQHQLCSRISTAQHPSGCYLGAIFGMSLLKEPRHPPKLVGVSIIFLGLVVGAIG